MVSSDQMKFLQTPILFIHHHLLVDGKISSVKLRRYESLDFAVPYTISNSKIEANRLRYILSISCFPQVRFVGLGNLARFHLDSVVCIITRGHY